MIADKTKTKTKTKKSAKSKERDFGIDIEKMAQAGVLFGHKISRIHPKIKPYLYKVRNAIHIIDLEKTAEKLREALEFVRKFTKENKVLLLIGTKIQNKDLVKQMAEDCDLPYVNEKWIGGTFTNFETISNRIKYFKELEEKSKKGEFEKYTKKERAKIDQEIQLLRKKFEGIKNMSKLPDVIFVLDMKKDKLAIKEARMKGIQVIGLADTNVDPGLADFPIPANDDAVSSVKYILEKVAEVIKSAKRKAQSEK